MNNELNFKHVPIMLTSCIDMLNINKNGIYVDGTVGGAGHSREIAKQLEGGKLYAFDQDPSAIITATQRLAGLPAQIIQNNFKYAKEELNKLGIYEIDGALLDLGVSSHQLDERQRGFSYHDDAPLDMRMSQSGQSAADIVNTFTREQLSDILRNYGEENYSYSIAGKIVQARQERTLETTKQLVECIYAGIPANVRRKDKHPARKTFQALRIAVNEELDVLKQGIENIFNMLKPNGRFCIITFHSLEDRIVKQQFVKWATACICPKEFPVCVCENKAKAKIITKKPIKASEEEQKNNPRSRSACLRVVEKI